MPLRVRFSTAFAVPGSELIAPPRARPIGGAAGPGGKASSKHKAKPGHMRVRIIEPVDRAPGSAALDCYSLRTGHVRGYLHQVTDRGNFSACVSSFTHVKMHMLVVNTGFTVWINAYGVHP
ncbi:hypothetical protein BRADI_2g11216v3 [Brachypodium distachyon]|uniref:Uncharacterized protein n=1 Tax=Brachypodium distachyon TaxID=15368 RepID=A0A2K2D7X7_BRADI|nr:hypothetical protein BRADI_2g11216v3 [Brachypodium distachyon]